MNKKTDKQIELKRYDKTFEVKISANTVADKLVGSLNSDLSDDKMIKLVDSIIGPMVSNDRRDAIKHLYFGLFDMDVEAPTFKDTDDMFCTHERYAYHRTLNVDYDPDSPDSHEEYVVKREHIVIGPCKLVGFDTYRSNHAYQIEYFEMNSSGITRTVTDWMDEQYLQIASDDTVEEQTGE